MDRILNMIVRQVVRQLVNRGISAGIDTATKKKSGQAPQDKEAAQRIKQSAKMMRRTTRL